MERVWPAGAQSRTRFRTEIKHASRRPRPLFSRPRRKLYPAAERRYSRCVRITNVIVNTRAKLHDPPPMYALPPSLEVGSPFSKGKFIPPLHSFLAPRSGSLLRENARSLVLLPWWILRRCRGNAITSLARYRFPSTHFLRRQETTFSEELLYGEL